MCVYMCVKSQHSLTHQQAVSLPISSLSSSAIRRLLLSAMSEIKYGYPYPPQGPYQGPPPVAAPPQYYAAQPPPRNQPERGFLEGCLAALCCCCLLDECCCDPTIICDC